ncbi:MAG: exonuclease domain-containing protein [Saprospiraceae bacterium]|nr:exonuclease domain-containing protein [Saprospiraceae bacterium]
MTFIIFDLEATCWEDPPPSVVQEIIEIGAIKLDDYGDEEDRFSRFVRPVVHPQLSFFCQKLTSINQVDINRADTFPRVIDHFIEWIGAEDGEDYLLCSWGGFDKRMFVQDCQLHRLEYDWTESHINLKDQYHQFKRLRKARSLRHVVELEGFDFTGTYHRGISDAENLAKVFVKYLDMWQF